MFHVTANRCRFYKVIKNANGLSQHQALHDASVRQITLSVMFGALCRGTTLRLLTGCSEYVMIVVTLSAPVPLTTVGVAFGARLKLIPMSPGEVASVGGSPMRVRRPDDVGREAGPRKPHAGMSWTYSGLARDGRPSVG